MISFIFMSLLGFFGGGILGKIFSEGFYPAAWIGLAVGIVLWILCKVGGGGALDDIGDAFDGFGD